MWETSVRGRPLHFRLEAINNQNFIMRDDETGSWWQQVTGEAVFGPLKGERLKLVPHDELTFETWKRERPAGRVLRPDVGLAAAGKYAPANWEEEVGRLPVVVPAGEGEPLAPREIVVGVELNGASKAYPLAALRKQSPVVDTLGGVPIVLVVGDDGQSVRAFDRTIDGRKLELFARPDARPLRLVDAATGGEWDFEGRAVGGEFAGRELSKLPVLKDYWFDWKLYHKDTAVYQLGER